MAEMLGWTAPYGIECARPRRCNNAAKRSRPNDDFQDWLGHVQGGVPGHVFQLHGVDENEQPVLQRRAVEKFFAKLPSARVGIAACGASHHWARVLCGFGHEVVLIPPQYIKPYVKRGKNDAIDAAAICEAMSRPTMRFVPVKTAEQQAALTMLGCATCWSSSARC